MRFKLANTDATCCFWQNGCDYTQVLRRKIHFPTHFKRLQAMPYGFDYLSLCLINAHNAAGFSQRLRVLNVWVGVIYVQ